MQNITILGATGSIGSSTLNVISENPDKFNVTALAAGSNVLSMAALCVKWKPKYAAMFDENAALQLEKELKSHGLSTRVVAGKEGLNHVASLKEVDSVMAAIVGAVGLEPTMAAVKAGKRILLANKEALVMSGQLFIKAAKDHGAQLLPVDSEHNAIFQCLPESVQSCIGYCDLNKHGIETILLTGSGGPFRYTEISALKSVSPEQAIAHPNWSMGPKISVDSATMMNKGLEFIEAKWLFNCSKDQLKVIIHPQSVIHSMVQYRDGSTLAQMGTPNMGTPIALSMSYPERISSGVASLDFVKMGELTFMEPDECRYPCLQLAIDACYEGQHATTAINAANEVAVGAFLNKQLSFTDIGVVNERVISKVCSNSYHLDGDGLESLLELDKIARHFAQEAVRERLL